MSLRSNPPFDNDQITVAQHEWDCPGSPDSHLSWAALAADRLGHLDLNRDRGACIVFGGKCWYSATIRNPALAQFATIIVCLPLVMIVANAMPQLMVDSQLKQSFSCHTKDAQEF